MSLRLRSCFCFFSVPKPASQTNQRLTLFRLTLVVDPSWNFGPHLSLVSCIWAVIEPCHSLSFDSHLLFFLHFSLSTHTIKGLLSVLIPPTFGLWPFALTLNRLSSSLTLPFPEQCIDCKSDLGGSEAGAEVRIRNKQLYCNSCYMRFKSEYMISVVSEMTRYFWLSLSVILSFF